MLMSMIRITVFICLITENVTTSSWATPEQEALDERRDSELYQAVVQSVADWKRHHNKSRYKRANEPSVCYGELGCFSASSPYLDVLPNSPTEVGTRFMLFSPSSKARASPSGPQPLEVPADDVDAAFRWAGKGQGLDPRRPTKVIVHGFGSNCAHIWVYEMRSALTAVEECNIICVDWENGATIPNYVRAAANTRLVGAQLARLLGGLQRHAGIAPETVHLIGFSLGAHVAGYAGAALSGNVSRITGLDPAGPLFESQDPRARLDQTDAVFVDVIHSNGENLILGGLGSWQPMGHVDFYPNGGRMQKGCSHLFVGAVSDIIWSSAIEGRSLCNHRRAYKFFTDSVSPRCHFPAFPCESYEDFISGKCFPCSSERKCGNMGYYADRSAGRGQLYLNTRDEEPFCAHQYQVKIESVKRDNALRSYGKILITLVGESDINETFTMTQKDDQELVLGGSLSKILVPHPVLGEPITIQLTYIAYSGWLSSGLTRWRINKVSLSDSFGKSSSICKKELDLETGVPVTLTLNSGDCNIPEDETNISTNTTPTNNSSETNSTIDDLGINNNSKNESKFQPTPVVHIGNEAVNKSLKKGLDRRESFTGNPWLPLRDYDENNSNSLDGSSDERETSRSLNSIGSSFKSREVVEPILKSDKSTNKIARSQNLHPTRKEISEPLLSSTTLRTTTTTKKYITKADIPTEDRILDISGEIDTFSDKNDWVPTNKLNYKDNVRPYITNQDDTIREINQKYSHDNEKNNTALTKITPQQKSNRELRKIHESNFYNYENKDIEKVADNIPDSDTAEQNSFIAITVQLLPQRLASMLDQAERYARMTLLPLITAHTPKILSDFVNSFTEKTPKYLPLKYDHENETSTAPDESKGNNRISNKKELIFDFYTFANETENDDSSDKIERRAFQENIPVINNCENCTNINNIRLNEGEILLENSTAMNKETEVNQDKLEIVEKTTTEEIINKPNNTKNLYVDLPVFVENKDEDLITDSTRSGAGIRYIPLKYDSLKDNNKNNKN